VRLTHSAERWVRKQHPWLYAESIRAQSRAGESGDLAVIYDHDRRQMALGLYDPDSPIRIRVLHRGGARPIDRGFFAERLRAAAALRAHLPGEGTTGFRLANGESDGLPGLVVDRYEGICVVKLPSWPYTRTNDPPGYGHRDDSDIARALRCDSTTAAAAWTATRVRDHRVERGRERARPRGRSYRPLGRVAGSALTA
jgi:23S rRNA G2069 N7-methylase RlmK/C1962 C5-methylase RlmI